LIIDQFEAGIDIRAITRVKAQVMYATFHVDKHGAFAGPPAFGSPHKSLSLTALAHQRAEGCADKGGIQSAQLAAGFAFAEFQHFFPNSALAIPGKSIVDCLPETKFVSG
jgi:hypothetical protein